MAKKIIVNFDDDGNVKNIETEGFKGSACMKETESIIQKLGTTVKSDKKPEFYQTTTQANAVRR